MKYAYKNGKILNGTKDMQVQTGLIILTEGEKIAAIVPEETRLSGYTEIDLQGKYIMPGLINMQWKTAEEAARQRKTRQNPDEQQNFPRDRLPHGSRLRKR